MDWIRQIPFFLQSFCRAVNFAACLGETGNRIMHVSYGHSLQGGHVCGEEIHTNTKNTNSKHASCIDKVQSLFIFCHNDKLIFLSGVKNNISSTSITHPEHENEPGHPLMIPNKLNYLEFMKYMLKYVLDLLSTRVCMLLYHLRQRACTLLEI